MSCQRYFIQQKFTSSLLTIALSSEALSVLCGRGLRATPEVAILPTCSPSSPSYSRQHSLSPLLPIAPSISHPVPITSCIEAIKLVIMSPLSLSLSLSSLFPSEAEGFLPLHILRHMSLSDLKCWVVMQLSNIEHMARSRTELTFFSTSSITILYNVVSVLIQ